MRSVAVNVPIRGGIETLHRLHTSREEPENSCLPIYGSYPLCIDRRKRIKGPTYCENISFSTGKFTEYDEIGKEKTH